MKNYALISKKHQNGSKIIKICPESELSNFLDIKKNIEIYDLTDKLIIPGLYDTHFHWVQDEVRHMPKDNLLKWLENYTWPYENKFKSKTFAKKKAKDFSQLLMQCGTIGGACYGSIHDHSVDEALDNFTGDFVVGNVLMTMNSPEYLTQSKNDAVDSVRRLAKKYRSKYAMTPRFAITTDPDTMTKCSKIARTNKSFIQTHLSETENEIDFVMSIYKNIKGFEDVKSYTDIYDRCGVLGKNTIMGHGIYLSPKELKQLSSTGTSVAHCPTSNAPLKERGLGSGLFDYKRADRLKVNWSLASDIGGGPFLSMLDVMNSFVKQNHKRGHRDASYIRALFRSTLAGASMLNLGESSGNFQIGKELNFVVLEKPRIFNSDTSEDILKRTISKKVKDRLQYESQVISTCYHGKFL